MRVHLISIGNELLIGQVVNTNASWMGQSIAAIGWETDRMVSIRDEHVEISTALQEGFDRCDAIITTGGLGPTKDDITKKAVADFFGVSMEFHEPTWEKIQTYFNSRKYPISDLHKLQCYMPKGSIVLENKLGTAPGLLLEKGGKKCFVLPGVPYEMQYLMKEHVIPNLLNSGNTEKFRQRTFHTAGTGESVIADHIETFESSLPPNVSIAYLPAIGKVRIRISMLGGEEVKFEALCAKLKELLQPWYFGEGDTSLEIEIAKLMTKLGLNLVLAESCTGGNIAARLVQLPGASSFFMGGGVVYSNEMKMKQLGVSPNTLEQFGAVSEEVVKEMVVGALQNMGGDVAAAVSGIAGPDGGSTDKPVGTVWMAVGNKEQVKAYKINFNKDRSRNIEFSSTAVLNMIRKFLIAVYLK